ncbi:MAG: hypothetical protein PWP31_1602 [Clostridia bacterium]|nr:hypothetical protein [Clostridia bacterium]
MPIKQLVVKTTRQEEMIDITSDINQLIKETGFISGVCHMFVSHTTCGLTINEHADPDVARDILEALNRMVPRGMDYKHIEGNSHAHLKASLMGVNQTILIEEGRLCLGTWQGIFLCEFDGPRQRKIWIKVIEA